MGICLMSKPVCAIVGAGPGLGLALAHKFGQEGMSIALISRSAESLQASVESLAQAGVEAQAFPADSGDAESVAAAFREIQDSLGAPEVLIYNAAAMSQTDVLSVATDQLMGDYKVNVVGAIVAIQSVAPAMKENKRGTILITGGRLATNPSHLYVSLSAGKAAVRNLALGIAPQLGKDGIHVATVTIGGYIQPETPFAPEKIAEVFWQLHAQERTNWTREFVFDGSNK
jgi:short-subunit dehydrogenase